MAENPDFETKSDNELVQSTLQNQDYFLYIVNRYEKKLLGFILRISNVSPDEARDLLQEVFIKVYQNLNGFDPGLKFSSWIYRITRNHVISHFRKNKNRPQALPFEFNADLFDNLVSDFDISRDIDQKLLAEKVAKALSKLKSKYQEVIILKYFEEKSYDEISDILKKPPGTVGSLINRAKKEFKNIWTTLEKKS